MTWHVWEDLGALVELAAPTACGGCGVAGSRWCEGCAARLTEAARRAGPWSPTPCPPGMPPTWSAAPYSGEVRAAVVAWKDGGRADLTAVLAPVLRSVLAAAVAGSPDLAATVRAGRPLVVVPAPSARASTRARGEHRVAALARAAVRGLPPPGMTVVEGLRLRRRVSDQAGLGAAARRRNLSGAVAVPPASTPALRGRAILVVDDVVTTGATLVECARALVEAGARPVIGATVAATRRTGQGGLEELRRAD